MRDPSTLDLISLRSTSITSVTPWLSQAAKAVSNPTHMQEFAMLDSRRGVSDIGHAGMK